MHVGNHRVLAFLLILLVTVPADRSKVSVIRWWIVNDVLRLQIMNVVIEWLRCEGLSWLVRLFCELNSTSMY